MKNIEAKAIVEKTLKFKFRAKGVENVLNIPETTAMSNVRQRGNARRVLGVGYPE